MGYDYSQIGGRFFLARQQQSAARDAVEQLFEGEEESIPFARSLPELLSGQDHHAWYWRCNLDLEGNIIGLELNSNRLYSSEQLFTAIAPFVAAGSFLLIRGEEGEEWRWVFDGQQIYLLQGRGDPLESEPGFLDGEASALSQWHQGKLSRGSILPTSDQALLASLQYRAIELLGAAAATERARQALLPLLDSSHTGLVAQTLWVLTSQPFSVPLETLRTLFHRHSNQQSDYPTFYNMRLTILHILGARRDQEALELLFDLLMQAEEKDAWWSYYGFAAILGEMGQAIPRSWFTRWLAEPRPHVRYALMCAMNTRAPLAYLLENLSYDEHWQHGQAETLRRRALQVLLRYQEPVPWEPLLSSLYDKDSYVRHLAATILLQQGSQVPLHVLVEALESDDLGVRGIIIEALLPYGKQAPIERIIELLLQNVYFWVIHTLEEGGSYRDKEVSLEALAPFIAKKRIEQIAQIARGKTGEAYRALDLLGRLGRFAPANVLIEIFESPPEKVWHEQAFKALTYPAVPVSPDVLERVATVPDVQGKYDELTSDALHGLARREVAQEVWARLLQQSKREVRVFAAFQGFAKDPEVLFPFLADEQEATRTKAVALLAEQTVPLPLHLLEKALIADSSWEREAALQLAEKLGPQVPLALLEQTLASLTTRIEQLADEQETMLELLVYAERAWLMPLRFAIWRRQAEEEPDEALLYALSDLALPLVEARYLLPRGPVQPLSTQYPLAAQMLTSEAEVWLYGNETDLAQPTGRYLASNVLVHHMRQLATRQQLHEHEWQQIATCLDWPYWPVPVEALRTIARLQCAMPEFILQRIAQLDTDVRSPALRLAARDAL